MDGVFSALELDRLIRAELVRQGVMAEFLSDEALASMYTDRFGVTARGVTFRLGHDLAAPGTDGAREISFTAQDLRGVLRADSPIARLRSP